jgi:pyrroline-5-carboxylate reductase
MMIQGRFKLQGTLAIIGGGRMGEAILTGLLAAKAVEPAHVIVAEPVAERRTTLDAAHGVRTTDSAAEAATSGDVVILAVKPQVLEEVLGELADQVGDALVISIAAGMTSARIETALPEGTAVVRVMPNTPAMVGEGMSVVSGGRAATAEEVDLARELMALLGMAIVLPEEQQDIATAISGSGPAYVALFVEALARAGAAEGLSREDAYTLALQTVKGTAALLEESGMHPEELVEAVSSPGGTTVAAVAGLEAHGFSQTMSAAVSAAVERARELGA